jgi:hypothetical protein
VPSDPVTAHDWQAPVQAELQQKPCAQMVDRHSVPSPQACPFGFRPHNPVVALHTAGNAQSAAVVAGVQLTLHAFVPHLKEPQDAVAGVVQAPIPSQVDAAVNRFVAAKQVGALHTVPLPYFWQTPAWHFPVVPQLAWPVSLQMPAGSALPVATFVHVPSAPDSAHDWQEPSQAELQQTPWAQKFDWHSAAAEHEAPGGFLPHELTLQTLGDKQLSLLVQALKQAVPLQT